MGDKRRFERVPFHEQIVVTCDGNATLAEARDISLGGMFINDISLPFGHRVTVHINAPGELVDVALPGVVRWTADGGVGIQFWLLGVRETHVITEIIAAHDADRSEREHVLPTGLDAHAEEGA